MEVIDESFLQHFVMGTVTAVCMCVCVWVNFSSEAETSFEIGRPLQKETLELFRLRTLDVASSDTNIIDMLMRPRVLSGSYCSRNL